MLRLSRIVGYQPRSDVHGSATSQNGTTGRRTPAIGKESHLGLSSQNLFAASGVNSAGDAAKMLSCALLAPYKTRYFKERWMKTVRLAYGQDFLQVEVPDAAVVIEPRHL